MGLFDMVNKMTSGRRTPALPEGQWVELERTGESGGLFVCGEEMRSEILTALEEGNAEGRTVHGGTVSSLLVDRVVRLAPQVSTTIQAGKMLMVVGSPEVMTGLKSGALKWMTDSQGRLLGSVQRMDGQIAGQLRFAPTSALKVMGPQVIWTVLNAVAGTQELRAINLKLDQLVEGVKEIIYRQQAQAYGNIGATIYMLKEIEKQYETIGRFTLNMQEQLNLAQFAVRRVISEQQFVFERYHRLSQQILAFPKGHVGASEARKFIVAEQEMIKTDGYLIAMAAQASGLIGRAWLAYDLEHQPEFMGQRLRDTVSEVSQLQEYVGGLTVIDELSKYALECVAQMSWFRQLVERSVVRDIRNFDRTTTQIPDDATVNNIPTFIVWKSVNDELKAVTLPVSTESAS